MKIGDLVLIATGAVRLLLAADDEAKQKVEIRHSQRLAFPANGTLRLENSTGLLTIEAWDRDEAEITTIKSSKVAYASKAAREKAARDLEKIRIGAERNGGELIVETSAAHHSTIPATGPASFDLEYRIKVPGSTRIVVNHRAGAVNIDGLTGDIEVRVARGEILLHLPEDGRYDIDAKCTVGHVNSDFPGEQKRLRWLIGHRIAKDDAPSRHKLNLKTEAGDIVILKIQVPKVAAAKQAGL